MKRFILVIFLFAALSVVADAQSIDLTVSAADTVWQIPAWDGKAVLVPLLGNTPIEYTGVRHKDGDTIHMIKWMPANAGSVRIDQWESWPIEVRRTGEPEVRIVLVTSQAKPDCRVVVKMAQEDRSRRYRAGITIGDGSVEDVLKASDDAFTWWISHYPACENEPEFKLAARKKWETDGLPQAFGRWLKRLFK